MLKAYQRTENVSAPQEVSDISSGEWVRLEEPSKDEIREVATALGLDESLIQDALDPFEAPRFEEQDGNVYIFLRYPFSKEPAGTAPFLIVLTNTALVTIALGTPSFLDRFASGAVPFRTSERTRLLILCIGEITARYVSAMTTIRRAVNRRKHRIDEMSEADIVEFATHEGAVNSFLDALVPQANVLAKIAAGKTIQVSPEEHELTEDVILSTTQLIELGRSILKTMENTREAYTAISTQQLNRVIRMLTALTVLVTIPNVITGFYGMNVALPGQDSPFAAVLIVLGIVTAIGLIVLLFRKKGWLF